MVRTAKVQPVPAAGQSGFCCQSAQEVESLTQEVRDFDKVLLKSRQRFCVDHPWRFDVLLHIVGFLHWYFFLVNILKGEKLGNWQRTLKGLTDIYFMFSL